MQAKFFPVFFVYFFDRQQSDSEREEMHFIHRDEFFATKEEAMDFAEIHAPITQLDPSRELIDECGGYLEVFTRDDGTEKECAPMSREEHDYWEAQANDTYDPDAAYERHLENAGWLDQARQDDWEAAHGCLDYWQSKALAEGRLPE